MYIHAFVSTYIYVCICICTCTVFVCIWILLNVYVYIIHDSLSNPSIPHSDTSRCRPWRGSAMTLSWASQMWSVSVGVGPLAPWRFDIRQRCFRKELFIKHGNLFWMSMLWSQECTVSPRCCCFQPKQACLVNLPCQRWWCDWYLTQMIA